MTHRAEIVKDYVTAAGIVVAGLVAVLEYYVLSPSRAAEDRRREADLALRVAGETSARISPAVPLAAREACEQGEAVAVPATLETTAALRFRSLMRTRVRIELRDVVIRGVPVPTEPRSRSAIRARLGPPDGFALAGQDFAHGDLHRSLEPDEATDFLFAGDIPVDLPCCPASEFGPASVGGEVMVSFRFALTAAEEVSFPHALTLLCDVTEGLTTQCGAMDGAVDGTGSLERGLSAVIEPMPTAPLR